MYLKRLSAVAASIGVSFLAFAGSVSADSIDPLTFSADLAVGESVTIEKTVTVNAGKPTSALIDVHFLFDTSASMGGRINGVKSAAASIFSGLDALGDVAAGVGVYSEAARLAPSGSVPGRVINQDITTNSATALAAINAVTRSNPDGGGDIPENGVTGIEKAVENLSWRPGSNRFLFIFGDTGFKTSDADEAGGTSGLSFDAFDNRDNAPISTAADALAALSSRSVQLFGFGTNNSFKDAVLTLGGDFILSGTDPDDIVDDIVDGVTGSFANYGSVTVDDLGGGLPEIDVSVVCTGADIGECVAAEAIGAYDRSVERTFTFDVTFKRIAAGDTTFDTFALVDRGIVATERDTFGGEVIPLPAAAWLLIGGLGALGAFGARRKKAA